MAAVSEDGLVETPWGRFDAKVLRAVGLDDGAGRRFPLRAFDDIELSTAPNYLVKGLLPREGLAVIWGPPKSGKSFWSFDLAARIALGWRYRDRKVQQGPTVYLMLEGEHGAGARKEAFRREFLNGESVPLSLLTTRLDLIADCDVLIQDIHEQTLGDPPVLIVVDTLNRSLSGSESRDEDMSLYIQAADTVREFFRCTVALVHHCGVDASRPRGHTSLTGAADAQIAVKRDPGGTICATLEWLKDGQEGAEIYSRLKTVEVGIDDEGDVITSCVIEPADAPPEQIRGHRLTRNQQTMLGLLEDFGPQGATVEDWNEKARQEGLGTNRKADLRDYRKQLKDKGLIHSCGDRWFFTKL